MVHTTANAHLPSHFLSFDHQGADTEENEVNVIILFFKIFLFLMWTIFKVLTEFVTTMLLFLVLVFWL